MGIEEEPKNENINITNIRDISASELYSKFDKWNKDTNDKMNKIGKKD